MNCEPSLVDSPTEIVPSVFKGANHAVDPRQIIREEHTPATYCVRLDEGLEDRCFASKSTNDPNSYFLNQENSASSIASVEFCIKNRGERGLVFMAPVDSHFELVV